jgi:hypothetical protein
MTSKPNEQEPLRYNSDIAEAAECGCGIRRYHAVQLEECGELLEPQALVGWPHAHWIMPKGAATVATAETINCNLLLLGISQGFGNGP